MLGHLIAMDCTSWREGGLFEYRLEFQRCHGGLWSFDESFLGSAVGMFMALLGGFWNRPSCLRFYVGDHCICSCSTLVYTIIMVIFYFIN